MNRWAFRILIALFAGACAWYLLVALALGHKTFEVDAEFRITPPGPSGLTYPAVPCMWANGYKLAMPGSIESSGPKTAHVICRLPKEGVGIPIHARTYTTTGRGFLIGAFLRPIPDGHPSCADPRTIVAAVEDPHSSLDHLCSEGRPPPKAEVALMAPFDDDKGRPTSTMRVVVFRAE